MLFVLAVHFHPLATHFLLLAKNLLPLATRFHLLAVHLPWLANSFLLSKTRFPQLVVNFPVLAINLLMLAGRFHALATKNYSIRLIKTFIFPAIVIKAIMVLLINSTFLDKLFFTL